MKENVPAGGRVGVDPFLHTVDGYRRLADKLRDAGRQLVPLLGGNLVDRVWGDARPALPQVGGVRVRASGWRKWTWDSRGRCFRVEHVVLFERRICCCMSATVCMSLWECGVT